MELSDKDITIQSWSELCERVYDYSWKDDLGRFRSDFAFRGLSNVDYELKNSFIRNCGNNAHLEYHILRNFKKFGQFDDKALLSSEWSLMTLAQNHGLPTRLLDWTHSPFIAAHFATAETSKYTSDGVIWQVDYVKVNKLLPDPLKSLLTDVGANLYTVEIIEELFTTLKDYDNLGTKNDVLVIFFEPPSINPRIVNQYALLSAMSSATTVFDNWLLEHPDLFRRIIIPKELKWEIRDKLDQANITERILFPGLDGLSKWLKRYYIPRN